MDSSDTGQLICDNESALEASYLNVPDATVVSPTPTSSSTSSTDSSIFKIFRDMTWRQRTTVFTAAFVNFTAMCCFAMMAPFLPIEAEAKDISSTTVGIIFASFQLVMFVCSIIFGRYLTSIGARFMYIGGILVASFCSILFGILEWCPPGTTFAAVAIACRVVEAVGCCMCQTASTAIVANEFPEKVATVLGIMESIAGIGMMIGPTIGGALYDLHGFYLPFVVVGGVFFLAGIIASITLPPVAIAPPKDRDRLFKQFVQLPAVIVCAISVVICAAMMTSLDPILSVQLSLLDEKLAQSQTLIGLVFLVMPALYAILSPVAGFLADSFKHQLPLLALGNAGFIGAFILIGPCPLLSIPRTLWLTIVSLVIMGMFCAFCFMPAFAIISKACSEEGIANDLDLFGLISGFFGFSFNLGALTGPLIGGVLVQHFGFEWATSIIALGPILPLAAIFIYAIYSSKGRMRYDQILEPSI